MSLARAFTTRRAKASKDDAEAKVSRGVGGGSLRSKISAPTHLVSTTNMLSYNAPDILRKISSPLELTFSTSALSYDAPDIQREPSTAASDSSMSFRSRDSDHIHTAASSPPTSPDSAFPRGVDDDSKSEAAETSSHLSSCFTLPSEVAAARAPEAPLSRPSRQPTPANSNTSSSERPHKKPSLSERLGRKPCTSPVSEQSSRSVSTKASRQFSRGSLSSTNTTASSQQVLSAHQIPKSSSQAPPPVPAALSLPQHRAPAAATEPFGQELAQVTELAEEYATSAASKTQCIASREEEDLAERGLLKFSPEEYLAEISSLVSTFFDEAWHVKTPTPQWI